MIICLTLSTSAEGGRPFQWKKKRRETLKSRISHKNQNSAMKNQRSKIKTK